MYIIPFEGESRKSSPAHTYQYIRSTRARAHRDGYLIIRYVRRGEHEISSQLAFGVFSTSSRIYSISMCAFGYTHIYTYIAEILSLGCRVLVECYTFIYIYILRRESKSSLQPLQGPVTSPRLSLIAMDLRINTRLASHCLALSDIESSRRNKTI